MKIGICIYDNDFTYTIRAFLNLLKDSVLVELHPENVTKANIVKVWNESILGIYLIAQNGFGYEVSEGHDLHVKRCLKLEEEHVFLEQECLDMFLRDNNSAYLYLDTETGNIYGS